MVTDEYFTGSENAPEDQEAAELLEPYLIDEIWPSFTYDAEENDEISILEADLEKYITEMQAAFITGETDFSEWDEDRKSTRLNSSHVAISYAVFCLKKKKNKER